MNQAAILAILASTFVGALTLPIGALFLKNNRLKKWLEENFISLCAGIMLGTALIDLLPEAFEMSYDPQTICMSLLAGIVGFFILERSTLWFHHHHESHGEEPTTKLILIGDGVHNFVDGVAIALAFLSDINLGIALTIAIILHEIPTEIGDLSVLINKGMKIKKAILWNFISALTSIVGTIAGILFFVKNPHTQAPILAIAAGMFIYIACSDLIPDLHKEHRNRKNLQIIMIFLLGLFITYLVGMIE